MRIAPGVLSLIIILMCFPVFSFASDPSDTGSGKVELSAAERTKQELLLFWDEKDLYVQSATRNMKPISQVAENMTIVTAKDIEDMNAHTVAEVLNRVTGVFVEFQGQDFGSPELPHIQGSADRHVLVLLDGVPWNLLNQGNAVTNSIPVRIIQRIEVIKGPASSAWGSSLGGVINIITKDTGNTITPTGSISASYGGAESQDDSAEIAGKAGPVGYYLFAGRQDSDGLRDSRSFRNNSFYSKFNIPLSSDVKLGLTAGYSEPRIISGDIPGSDLGGGVSLRTFFATASLDAAITKELTFQASLYTFKQKLLQATNVLGEGFYGEAGPGELFLNIFLNERTTGGGGKLVWTHGIHTAVLGVDISHGNSGETLDAGPFLQSIGTPATSVVNPGIDKWALFANDSITLGAFSITPGIRYDHNSVSGSFVSPSLGATYKLGEHTILRASVARGFTIPPLGATSAGGLFLDPNPSLKQEKVWSYQAGIESSVTDYLWAKATIFYHDMKDQIAKVSFAGGPPGCSGLACNDLFENTGTIKRQGLELEAETIPLYNLSLKAGFAFVSINPSDLPSTVNYEYNLGLKYDDKKSFMAQLFGHYLWWNVDSSANANYNAFIWDLNASKRIYSTQRMNFDIFAEVHNLLNGSQYNFGDQKNPGRWAEAGLRVKF